MKRKAMKALAAWKDKRNRKPLILRGARQVGKTWLMKEFGRLYFKDTVYVNFENTPELSTLFLQNLDVHRILQTLQLYAGKPISPTDTLIIFDEIQSIEKGLTSLKYFCEDAPQYAVIAAGSLLGMGLHSQVSFPVGKVDFMDIRPLSFYEFLDACDKELWTNALRSGEWSLMKPFHEQLVNLLRIYLYVGGMPEVVQTYIDTKDFIQVRENQRNIIYAYQADFSKHAPYEIVPRIQMVWESIPAQLAKENKKFIYGVVREGARAKDFELAIMWLVECGLLLKSHRISKPYMPLIAYQDTAVFKLFLVDVGLLSAMSHLDSKTLIMGDAVFTEFKGAQTEQFVMQELTAAGHDYIGYWTNEKSTAEVDFIVQKEGEIFPIEVKAETNVRAKSFKLFCEKYHPTQAYRSSLLPYQPEEWMTNLPLYGIGNL